MGLIAYMLQPETQVATLRADQLLPGGGGGAARGHAGLGALSGPAITAMTGAPDALPALLPIGLGDLGGQFNQVYIDTFERIMLGEQDIAGGARRSRARRSRACIDEAGAPCWAPDPAVGGPLPGELSRQPGAALYSLHNERVCTSAAGSGGCAACPARMPLPAALARDALPLRLLPLPVRARGGRGGDPRRACDRARTSSAWRRTGSSARLAQHPAPRRGGRADPARHGARHGEHRRRGSRPGRSAILYIFAIPLGISDLAAGLIWLAIFEQSGFLNSALSGLGVIERPILFLGYQNPVDHLRRHRRSPRSGGRRRS